MKTLMTLTLACCLAIAGAAYAQPDSLWSRTYGGTRGEYCSSLIQTADGGFAMAGGTSSFGTGSSDFWLVRPDENGDSLWSRTYGGNGGEACLSLVQTTDGGYALAGCTKSFGAGDYDFWLVRTDENGDSLWSRTYGGSGDETCQSLVQTTDGGYALAGCTKSFGAGDYDFWLVRTDENGDSLWSRTFGGDTSDFSNSLIQTADGGFALAGETESFGAGDHDFWLVRTDANGDSLWSRTFGGTSFDVCFSFTQTADGGFALAGSTVSFGEGFVKLWLVRTDEDGDSLWSHSYGSVEDNRCNSIIQTDDGGFALAGMILFIDTPRRDMGLVRTDENGDSLWACNFGGGFEDYCFSLIQAADGGFALAGGTESFGAGQSDFWLVKTGPDPVSVSGDFILHPSSFILSPPFPNPFNSITVVGYSAPGGSVVGWVNLSVYDLSGRMVQTLANGYQSAGPHTLVWNAPDIAAGEYVIVLTGDEGKAEAQKVVLIK